MRLCSAILQHRPFLTVFPLRRSETAIDSLRIKCSCSQLFITHGVICLHCHRKTDKKICITLRIRRSHPVNILTVFSGYVCALRRSRVIGAVYNLNNKVLWLRSDLNTALWHQGNIFFSFFFLFSFIHSFFFFLFFSVL